MLQPYAKVSRILLPIKGQMNMDDFQTTSQDDSVEEDTNIEVSASTTEDENIEAEAADENVEPEAENSQEDQVTFTENQQAKFDKVIGEKVAKTHEERRRADQLEAEVKELRSKVPEPTVPEVPALPNPNDFYGDPDGYNQQLAQRDLAMQQRATFDANNRMIQDQQAQQVQRADYEKAQKQQATIQSYAETARSFGINAEQMQQDAQIVMQAGIAPEISDHIVSDPQGALITSYLKQNVLVLDKVAGMSPMAAAVYIANEVKPKLSRKSSSAPAPAKIVGGGGTPSKVPASIKGAKFE